MASYRLAIRRDTAANWTSANPVLAQGEFGYEADTGSLKIGDGATAWSALPYYTSLSGASLNDLGDVDLITTPPTTGDLLEWDGTNFVPVAPTPFPVDTDYVEKQYRYDGALAVSTGAVRLYVPADIAQYAVNGHLGTASTSGDVTVDILKNGAVDASLTILQGASTGTVSSSTSFVAGDYITIDITGAGDASDLYLTLSLERT